MANEKNMELICSGIKCDTPNCGWRDDSVKHEDYLQWVNKPCPKCGGNLLTEEDYRSAEILHLAADFINELSVDELTDMVANIPPEQIEEMKKNPIFAQMTWPDESSETPIVIQVETNGTGEMKFKDSKAL